MFVELIDVRHVVDDLEYQIWPWAAAVIGVNCPVLERIQIAGGQMATDEHAALARFVRDVARTCCGLPHKEETVCAGHARASLRHRGRSNRGCRGGWIRATDYLIQSQLRWH